MYVIVHNFVFNLHNKKPVTVLRNRKNSKRLEHETLHFHHNFI